MLLKILCICCMFLCTPCSHGAQVHWQYTFTLEGLGLLHLYVNLYLLYLILNILCMYYKFLYTPFPHRTPVHWNDAFRLQGLSPVHLYFIWYERVLCYMFACTPCPMGHKFIGNTHLHWKLRPSEPLVLHFSLLSTLILIEWKSVDETPALEGCRL